MSRPFTGIDVFLQPGEFRFGDEHTRIRTLLGSCVAMTFWHPGRRIGAMCHYLLGCRPEGRAPRLDPRYGEDALLMFVEQALRLGTDPGDYVVKMFGAGSMFPQHRAQCSCGGGEGGGRCHAVPCRNAAVGRSLLRGLGIPISAEHVGGSGHRNVIFDLATGHVWLRHTPIVGGKEGTWRKSGSS